MPEDRAEKEELDALRREVSTLRVRVAELQRSAARHEETEGVSLAEREELLREAERVAHLGTWTWDRDSGRVTWSEELYRILGIQPGSVEPSVEAFYGTLHPEDRAHVEEATNQSLREGVLSVVDWRIVRPDGSVRYTTVSSSMLYDAAGVPRRIVGSVLDRTESRQAEAALRRTLGLLEEAQRMAQLGSWRFDPSSGQLEWSEGMRRILGVALDAQPDTELFVQLVVPEDRAKLEQARRQFSPSDPIRPLDLRLKRLDGELRHVRLEGFAKLGADGRHELRGTVLDTTEQVRMREELIHAQKMQAVGRLAGGIAHDFNNLLTVVGGNLELLIEDYGPLPELESSLRALDSAAQLTQRLLAFGRKARLTLQVVDANALVRSTADLMRRLVGDEVRLELALSAALPSIQVDPIEIERALVNLVVNARDAMPSGGVVRVGTSIRAGSDGPMVELSVADEGAGIDAAARPHIFEPFYTTREGSGGSGLGLATVLGTAEQHGGSVRVEPGMERGTVFTISLPATLGSESERQVRDNENRAPVPAPKALPRTLRLFVVDDEAEVARVTQKMLEKAGHQVQVATDPEEALQLWCEHGPSIDLVVCDVAMSRMRGPELVQRMAGSGPTPRVLFITGYSEEAVRLQLEHSVLPKPFSPAALLQAVEAVTADSERD